MQDRFKFRVPFYDWDDNFIGFDELDIEQGIEPYNYGRCYHKDAEQCTGLHDKNGKLIYEGDIVKETSFDEDSGLGREFEETSVICFGGGDYPCSFTMKSKRFYRGFALLNYGINRLELEIIGNIHENADLLENKDE